MANVYIKTLGCKVNNYDSQALTTQLQELGYLLLDYPEDADILVLNTCSVTQNATKEARYLVRKMKRTRPDALFIATGCYAETNPEELSALDSLHFVAGNSKKGTLAATIDSLYRERRGISPHEAEQLTSIMDQAKSGPLSLIPTTPKQARAYLRIQDGCESFCSYCIIPYARGQNRSVPSAEIFREAIRLEKLGLRELILAGIHIGNYGRDLPEFSGDHTPLVTLTHTLITSVLQKSRLRFSSLEPMELHPGILALARAHPKKLCSHFHLPLQSGSDRILKLMNRPYNTAEYIAQCTLVREFLPDANITTDVIVGFPGESEVDFLTTMTTILDAGVSKIHVFPYSARAGTPAASMPEQVDAVTLSQRASRLRMLSAELEEHYMRRFVGCELSVIWEHTTDSQGRTLGHAENYLEVALQNPAQLHSPREPSMLKIVGLTEDKQLLGVLESL